MLTQQGIEGAVSRIALMPFFPSSDSGARAVVAEELLTMCESDAHALWLAIRMGQVFKSKWPGVGEMRALYCKRFRPTDGYEVSSESYPDGFPTEQQLGILRIKGLPDPIPALEFVSKADEKSIAKSSREFIAGLLESTEMPR